MRIGMIGLGNMGTAVANNIAGNGHQVVGWEFNIDTVGEINRFHSNTRYLKGVKLSPNLKATTNIEEALCGKDIIFVALPSKYIKPVLTGPAPCVAKCTIVVNLSKGIEEGTLVTASGMLSKIFKKNRVITLSGPSIANEFGRGLPCMVVLTGDRNGDLCKAATAVETPVFRARFSNDRIGVEWSGILKNMYAIGLGIIHGLGMESINFKAAYITRALDEMIKLIEAMGGKKKTVLDFTGIGDLIATSLSEHSHNRRFGEMIAAGKSLAYAEKQLGVLPEGLKALRTAEKLSKKYRVKMPVAGAILKVIDKKMKPSKLIENFMETSVENERKSCSRD
jgi:glycerol-3-phosphate dehydrogenase (NAD(P)+)